MATWTKSQTGRPDLTETVRSSVDLIADRIDNCDAGLDGTEDLDSISIIGGSIDGTTIGGVTPDDGSFTSVTVDNININGNTIISSNTNGDINITPNGNGGLVVSGQTELFLSWDSSTYNYNTPASPSTNIYLADRDLLVCAVFSADIANAQGYTDSSASPTTIITAIGKYGGSYQQSLFMPVKKGDYWKVVALTGSGTLYVLPLGA